MGLEAARATFSDNPGAESSFSARIAQLLARIDCRRADTGEQREAIFRLRYQAYLRDGSIFPNSSGSFSDPYDKAGNVYLFGLYIDDELAGSIRIHVGSRECPNFPSLDVFPDILQPELDAGKVIIDPTRFVTDENLARVHRGLPYAVARLCGMAAQYFNADHLLAAVRVEHQAFYRRAFNHQVICEPRPYPHLAKPISLMTIHYPTVWPDAVRRYPFYGSTHAQRRMLFERAPLQAILLSSSVVAGCRDGMQPVSTSIYLINPLADFPSYFSAEVFEAWGVAPATSMADLAIATVAALASHHFEVRLCDENVSPIDFDAAVDFVGITGKVSQWGRMKTISEEFRRRGVTVVIGGPYASLSPNVVRPHCDILVRGEIEDIAPQLFSDLRSGNWQTEYVGTKVDLRVSPVPRWDLYPNERAVMGTIQTSRGCPFECEFCDVIEYVGRKQRHKPIDLVLRELDELYRYGYRTVFLADDNFTIYRARAKELLAAIHDWNARQTDGRIRFTTQISIDAASDTEMLRMCADAGLTHVFIGIETPDEASLREAKKRQNLKRNLLIEIQRIIDYGISVDCGMIVGFDNDDVSIFRRQYEFAMATAVPIFSLGALVAPAATPLHARLAKAGRLVENGSEIAATPWSTNVIPKNMTRDELFHGIGWLCNSIYHPAAFEQRMLKLIDTLGSMHVPAFARRAAPTSKPRAVINDAARLLQRVRHLGPAEEKMFASIINKLRRNREAAGEVLGCLLQYCQVRHMYERCQLWDPTLGQATDTLRSERPLFEVELAAAQ